MINYYYIDTDTSSNYFKMIYQSVCGFKADYDYFSFTDIDMCPNASHLAIL